MTAPDFGNKKAALRPLVATKSAKASRRELCPSGGQDRPCGGEGPRPPARSTLRSRLRWHPCAPHIPIPRATPELQESREQIESNCCWWGTPSFAKTLRRAGPPSKTLRRASPPKHPVKEGSPAVASSRRRGLHATLAINVP